MFAISTNIPDIKGKLERIKKLATGSPSWQDDMAKILKGGLQTVKRLTPKSTGAGGQGGKWVKSSRSGGSVLTDTHIRDGWTLRMIGKGGKDRVPVSGYIYNKMTHKIVAKGGATHKPKALLRKVDGTVKTYTLLEVLEYGSPPHVIRPGFGLKALGSRSGALSGGEGASILRFKVGGKVVFAKEVHHPGTRPYGMVRITNAKIKVWLKQMMRKWDRKVTTEWKRD